MFIMKGNLDSWIDFGFIGNLCHLCNPIHVAYQFLDDLTGAILNNVYQISSIESNFLHSETAQNGF